MSNDKDFVVDGYVLTGAATKQNTGSVSSTVSSVAVADLSEAVLDNLAVSAMSGNGIAFNSDGTFVYYTRTSENVYQYALSTAWDVTTIAGTATTTLDVSAVVGALNGLCFNSDGTKMYLQDGSSADTLYQYALSTAYDLSTATYENKSFYFGGTASYVIGDPSLHNNDQTLLLPEYIGGQQIRVYTLSTPGDITTATQTSSRQIVSNPYCATFNPDGTKLYTFGPAAGVGFQEHTLATAYSVASAPTSSVQGPTLPTTPFGLLFKPDGEYLFTDDGTRFSFTSSQTNLDIDLSTGNIFNVPLVEKSAITISNPPSTGVQNFKVELDTSASTSYDLSNVSLLSNSVSGTLASQSNDIYVRDSSRFYTLSISSQAVVSTYDMTDFDASTAVLNGGGIIMNDSGDYQYNGGLFFKPDGSKVFIMGSGYQRLSEFSLSSPWAISSHTYTTYETYNPSDASTPSGIFFKPDGTRFYINYTNRVYQFDISTAWSINGGTANGSFLFSGNKYGLAFNDDGTKMFVSESAGVKRLEEYTLSTPWDVSTASLTTIKNGLHGTGLSAADDGNKLFILLGGKAYEHSFGKTLSTTYPSSFTWSTGEPSLKTDYTSYAVTSDGGTTYLLK